MRLAVRGFHYEESYDETVSDSSAQMLYDLKNDGKNGGGAVLDRVRETRDKVSPFASFESYHPLLSCITPFVSIRLELI